MGRLASGPIVDPSHELAPENRRSGSSGDHLFDYLVSPLVQAARARLVGDRPNDWQTYHRFIQERLRPGLRVLEVGCGLGHVAPFPWRDFPDVELIGIDPNPEACHNALLHRFELLTNFQHWPIEDSSIDLAISRFVLEHVEHPGQFFQNLNRVLRPGGTFIALTPNRFHPACIVSSALPLRTKQWILKRTGKVDENDVFPTWYRANTVARLSRYAKQFGLWCEHLDAHEFVPNSYLNFNLLLFFLPYSYWLAVRWLRLERWLGQAIVMILRKPESPAV